MRLSATQILFRNIKELIDISRGQVVQAINARMVETYFQIGKLVIEYEQKGKARAEYAAKTLKILSNQLINEFGRGFSVDNLENMRRFYLLYEMSFQNINKTKKIKSETLSRKLPFKKSETPSRIFQVPLFRLSWSHYQLLIRIEDDDERKFYEVEATNEKWSVRELKRQYDSSLFERLSLSRNKSKIKQLSKEGHIVRTAADAIKDPYILEFLSLKEHETYNEAQFESALISKLEEFLKELGKGFLFVGRQYRITFDEDHFYIDLVFYHRILHCFVLLDLKIGELKHQDIGQMQMYVNYFDDEVKEKNENKTIGIILCKNKKESIVKYTLPKNNDQIFTSKYKTYLPGKDELKLLMEPEVIYNYKN